MSQQVTFEILSFYLISVFTNMYTHTIHTHTNTFSLSLHTHTHKEKELIGLNIQIDLKCEARTKANFVVINFHFLENPLAI